MLHHKKRTAHIRRIEIVKIPHRMIPDSCSFGDTGVGHEHIQSLADDGANFPARRVAPSGAPRSALMASARPSFERMSATRDSASYTERP